MLFLITSETNLFLQFEIYTKTVVYSQAITITQYKSTLNVLFEFYILTEKNNNSKIIDFISYLSI